MESGTVRKRRGAVSTACLRCHRRKQRCVGYPICGNCTIANSPCSRPSSVAVRRLAGLSKEELLKRIETLDERISGAVVAPAPADGPRRQQDESQTHPASQPRIDGACLSQETELAAEEESHCTLSSSAVGTAASRRPILVAYLENMHRRIPFCSYVDILKTNEGEAAMQPSTCLARMSLIRLYMACAIGARVKQLMGNMSPAAQAAEFLNKALALHAKYQEEEAADLVDQAEISLWLVLYELRTSYNNKAWDLIGSAMRAAVAADLHRARHYHDHVHVSPPEAERHCLLFWAIYTIERNVCWAMRRPLSLADYDIDAPLPTPLSHPACLQGVDTGPVNHASDSSSRPVDLKIFIATISLARINSQVYVQDSRPGRGQDGDTTDVLPLLEQLREFEATLPQCSAPDYEFLQLHVNNAVRMLIEPLLHILDPSDSLTRSCLDAAGAVCWLFKRLRLNRSIGFSSTMVKSVFLAGMTICFIISKTPSLWTPGRANDLRACSSSLFAAAERNPGARDYCETLDAIIEGVSDYVEQVTSAAAAPITNTSPRSVLPGGPQTLQSSLTSSPARSPQDAFNQLRQEFRKVRIRFASPSYPSFSLEPQDLHSMNPFSCPGWASAASVREPSVANSLDFDAAQQSTPFDLFSEGFDMGRLDFFVA